MDSHYDVIVVGGRVRGRRYRDAACTRGSAGARDRGHPSGAPTRCPRMRSCVAACLQLHRWGLLDSVVASGTPAIHATRFSYGDDDQTVEIRPGDGISALRAPRRTVLDALLLDAARAAGAEILSPARVTRLLTSGGTVCGVEGVTRGSGVSFRATATLTVGADGRGSTVARAVGAKFHRRGSASGAIIYGYFPGLARDQLPLGVSPGSHRGCGADR